MDTIDGLDVLVFADSARWEAWLAEHHERTGGVWVKIAKKGSSKPSVTITEALDVALCYGWIDGQRKAYDEVYYLQRYTTRRPKSSWSQVNVGKAEALIAAGRMREPGHAAIRAAKADGRWAAAYPAQRDVTVPDDLAAALAADGPARERFELLDGTSRYVLLLRILKAKTPQSRAVQLRRVVASLTESSPPGGSGEPERGQSRAHDQA